jgi:hypothetical protein
MFCPKCKQFARKVVFGFVCGCTVVTGHAQEPLHRKVTPPQTVVLEASISISSASVAPFNLGSSGFLFSTGGSTKSSSGEGT